VLLVQLTLIGATATLYIIYDEELQKYAALSDSFSGGALN